MTVRGPSMQPRLATPVVRVSDPPSSETTHGPDLDAVDLADVQPQAEAGPRALSGLFAPADPATARLFDLLAKDRQAHPASPRDERVARVTRSGGVAVTPALLEHIDAVTEAMDFYRRSHAEADAGADAPVQAAAPDDGRARTLLGHAVAALDTQGATAISEIAAEMRRLGSTLGGPTPNLADAMLLSRLVRGLDADMQRRPPELRRAYYEAVEQLDVPLHLSVAPQSLALQRPLTSSDGVAREGAAAMFLSAEPMTYTGLEMFSWTVSLEELARRRLGQLRFDAGHGIDSAVRAVAATRASEQSQTEQLRTLEAFLDAHYAHHNGDVVYREPATDPHGRAESLVRNALVDDAGARRIDCEGYHALIRRVLEDPSLGGGFRVRAIETPNHIATLVTAQVRSGEPEHFLFDNGELTPLGSGRIPLTRIGQALGQNRGGVIFGIHTTAGSGAQPQYVYAEATGAIRRYDGLDAEAMVTLRFLTFVEAMRGRAERKSDAIVDAWPNRRARSP